MSNAPPRLAEVIPLARRALDKFLADLPALAGHPDAQVHAIIGMLPHFPAFPAEDQRTVIESLARITGRPAVWVARVFDLSPIEVRRALRSQPPRLDRHGHETVYPSDGWLGAYLLYAQDSEAPLGWHFWCAAAILGMVARRNFYWDKGRYILYLNHYLMMIGETGLKKTTSIMQTVEILRLAAEKASVDGSPVPFYFSPDRATPEALDADLSAWHKAQPDIADTICAILNDEVVTLLGKNVWGGDKLIHFLTAVYGGQAKYRDASIGRGKREMTNLQITCLFGSAPDWIRDSVTDEMLTGGFLGRCIMVPRHEPHGIFPEPLPSDPVVKHTLAETLVPWIAMDTLVELRRTPEATEWYNDWYHGHRSKKPADPRLLGWWNRKDDHLHKLAAVLRLSEMIGSGKGAVDETRRDGIVAVGVRTFEQAIRILDDEESRLPKLMAMVGASVEARNNERLMGLIEEAYRKTSLPIPHSLLLRKAAHFLGDAWHFDRAISTLAEQDLVIINQPAVPGVHRRGRTYMPSWASGSPTADAALPRPPGNPEA